MTGRARQQSELLPKTIPQIKEQKVSLLFKGRNSRFLLVGHYFAFYRCNLGYGSRKMEECWDKISGIMRTFFFHYILHKTIMSTISEENIIPVWLD